MTDNPSEAHKYFGLDAANHRYVMEMNNFDSLLASSPKHIQLIVDENTANGSYIEKITRQSVQNRLDNGLLNMASQAAPKAAANSAIRKEYCPTNGPSSTITNG